MEESCPPHFTLFGGGEGALPSLFYFWGLVPPGSAASAFVCHPNAELHSSEQGVVDLLNFCKNH